MDLLNKQLVKVVSYPEKVLQFGTGVLLRGLPDYFIEKANRAGLFGGSIVAIKSTDSGGAEKFDRQQGLYTLHVKGLERGAEVQETWLVSAISRVLSAANEWESIMDCARNPEMEVVISNTTEVGIVLDEQDKLFASPPVSFPGKLTAWLYERFRVFDGAADKGMVILPTELIDRNGDVLRDIVVALAESHRLGAGFIDWVRAANHFCNTLVDRIVPGSLGAAELEQAERELGYRDELAIMAEPFCLWAIEASSPRVSEVLSFARADSRVAIAPDIQKFKELKLRLLNGSHTFSCGLALCCGFETVKEAMGNPAFLDYVRRLMQEEIVPTLAEVGISDEEATAFAESVIDRFGNPYLHHRWLSISTNYSTKMQMRNMATLKRYVKRFGTVPQRMALGFAGYLRAMGNVPSERSFADWQHDLEPLDGFREAVQYYVDRLQKQPAVEVLDQGYFSGKA